MINPCCSVFNDFVYTEKFITIFGFYKSNSICIVRFAYIAHVKDSIAIILYKIINIKTIYKIIKLPSIIVRIKNKPYIIYPIGIFRI